MSDNEIHDLALTSAKYQIQFNTDKYRLNTNGFNLIVSDLLTYYLQAKKIIKRTLPNTN